VSTTAPRPAGPTLAAISLLLILAAVAPVISLSAVPVSLPASSQAKLAIILACLTASSALASALLWSWSRALGWIGAAIAGLGLAWHWRERIWPPESRLASALVAIAATVLVALIALTLARSRSRLLRPVPVLAFFGCSLLAPVAAYLLDPPMRWAMFRHVRSIGMPLYLLLDRETQRTSIAGAGRSDSPEAGPVPDVEVVAAQDPTSPNVVLILVDTLRADAIPPWGSSAGLPAFDRLARRSVVLADVHANSSWTRASVGSLFTGLQPEVHGARDREDALRDESETLAERFAAAGYQTVAVVANYSQVGRDANFHQGFLDFDEPPGKPYARAEAVVDRFLAWRSSGSPASPYFAYLHLLDPHSPYLSGETTRSLRPEDQIPAYRAEVHYLDGHLGRLLDRLDQEARPTIVVLTADHGEEFGEHGGDFHGRTLYREVLHVPVLVAGTSTPPSVLAVPLELRDLYDLIPRLTDSSTSVVSWAELRRRTSRYSSVHLTSLTLPFYRPHLRFVRSQRLETNGFTVLWSGVGNTVEVYESERDPGEIFDRSDDHALLDPLVAALARSTPPWTAGARVRSSQMTEAQLRSLGYL
jgi:hypothetical protein